MISEIVVYRGKEYDATILSDYIWIRSKSSEDMRYGFKLENGVYCKSVTFSEIDAAYRIDKYAIIDGIRCPILSEKANEVTVVFDNVSDEPVRYYELNEAYDRGMYRKTYPKSGIDFEIVRTEYDLRTGRYKQTEPVRQIISGGKEVKQIEETPKEAVRSTDDLTENVAQIVSQKNTARISFVRMDYEEWFKFDIKLQSDNGDHTTYLGSVGIVSNSNHDIVLVDRQANDLKDIVFNVNGQALCYEAFNQILQYAKQHNKLSDKVANKCFKKAYQMFNQAEASGKCQQQNRIPQTMDDIVEQENRMHGSFYDAKPQPRATIPVSTSTPVRSPEPHHPHLCETFPVRRLSDIIKNMNRSVSVRLWPVHLSNMEVWFKCDDNHLVGRNTEVHQSLFVVAPKAPEYNYYEGEYYYANVLDLDTFKQIVAYAEMCGMISHETGDKFIQRAITQKATLDDID